MNIKEKTIDGIFWSFIDTFAGQGIQIITGVILARILSPIEFGLIGMITIFIALSETIINSGFSAALIRKKDCTQDDYSTIFYFNIVIGLIFCSLLFLSSNFIGNFYNEPKLPILIKVLSSVLIIDSLSLIQKVKLTKLINFKLQSKISLFSSFISGIIAITMAYYGYGVWSLIALQLIKQGIFSFLLWYTNKWVPSLIFSKKSFKELFNFGSKLLISGLLDTLYRNVYYLIIGKYFSAKELGYYTRADLFNNIVSTNLTGIITRVTYPVLSEMQDSEERLKLGYKRILKSIMLISTILMIMMAAIAEPLIITLIGEKWRQSILYLQLLSFIGIFYPLQALNLNILKVKGRSDLFLRLEIIKKIMAIPLILILFKWGIIGLICGLWANTLFSYYVNSYYSGKLINYKILEQLKDILPSFIIASFIGLIIYLIGQIISTNYLNKLIIQIVVGLLLVPTIGNIFKYGIYLDLQTIIISKSKFIISRSHK